MTTGPAADSATAVAVMAIAGPAAVEDPVAAITHLRAMATIFAMGSPPWAADARKQPRFQKTAVAVETITRESVTLRMATPPTGRITRKFPTGKTVIAITETIEGTMPET